jgi:ribA/ribD-fused uncharacterized protein
MIYRFTSSRESRHPFSNFYPSPAAFEDIEYPTSENAFQAAKTLDIVQRKLFEGISPGEAKSYGRRVDLRSDWEDVKFSVMVEVLKSKFFRDATLISMLCDTGDALIVEDTTGWHDNEWGDCTCPKCVSKEGKNLLGKALMEVRAEIRARQEA